MKKDEKKYYAVIGYPVGHSLSPAMQNAGFAAAGLNAEYMAVEVVPDQIGAFVQRAKEKLSGFNITVPHKTAIIPFLDEVDPLAGLQQSVNTVSVRNSRLTGTSTDGYGLEIALYETFSWKISGGKIVFIGCGGVVKALSFYFASQGIRQICLLNRTLSTAEDLCRSLQNSFTGIEVHCGALSDTEKVRDFLNDSSVAVQCTSLGLKEGDPPPVDPALLPEKIFFYDTIYRKTALLEYAQSHNIVCSNGLSMLLHQGAKSFSIWTGCEAPVEAMRRALMKAFQERIIS